MLLLIEFQMVRKGNWCNRTEGEIDGFKDGKEDGARDGKLTVTSNEYQRGKF